MTPEEFQQKVIAHLQQHYPQYSPKVIDVNTIELDKDHRIFLENLYAEVKARNFQNWEKGVDFLLRPMSIEGINLSKWEVVELALFPQIKHRNYISLANQELSKDEKSGLLMSKPLIGEDLFELIAIDMGTTMTYMTETYLNEWNKSMEEIENTAMKNLIRLPGTNKIKVAKGPSGNNLLIYNTNDGYDAARVLLPGFYNTFSPHLDETFVVGIPNRDFLVAATLTDAEFIAARVEEDYKRVHHSVFPNLIKVSKDNLTLWTPAFH